MNNRIDIRDDHYKIVVDILKKHLAPTDKVFAYGSRVKWTTKSSSDLDLAIVTDRNLFDIIEDFEESDLPYKVDIMDYKKLPDNMRDEIDFFKVAILFNWQNVKLGDVITFQRGYDLPKIKMLAGDIPVVGSNSIIGYHNKYTTESPFLSIGRSGNVGTPFYLEQDCWAHNTCLFVKEIRNAKMKFIYYLLKTINLKNFSGGSAVPTLNRNHLNHIPILLPPLPEQERIADILSAFDDKIELNSKISSGLEDLARLLFRRDFIDNEANVNWDITTLSKFIINTLSGDWGKEKSTGEYTSEVYCVRGSDIPNLLMGTMDKIPKRFILEKNFIKKQVFINDLIVEISGGSPTQSTGRIAYIHSELFDILDRPFISTNFCRVLRTNNSTESLYVYHYWKYLYDNKIFFKYENGTTGIKNLDITNVLAKEEIRLPPKELLEKFENTVAPMYQKIKVLQKENINLRATRDLLLPRLIKGEI